MKPHIKALLALIFILSVVLAGDFNPVIFGVFVLILAAVVVLCRINIFTVLKRTLAVIPFTLLIAVFIPFLKEGNVVAEFRVGPFRPAITDAGLALFKNILIKSFLSISAMSVLSATTGFSELIEALEKLKFPRIIIMLLSFMYRYLFVLAEEAARMSRARNMRYFGGGLFRQLRTTGNIIATLLLRALERSERVYSALCMRGFCPYREKPI